MRDIPRLAWILTLIFAAGCSQEKAETAGDALQDEQATQKELHLQQRADARIQPPVDAEAQRELGMNYYLGQSLEPDHAEALVWFRKAADQGEPVAQMFLGVMHLNGQEVPRDNVQAYKWFSISAEQVSTASKRLDQVAKRMTTAEIAEAARLAREWKPAAWPGPRPKD